MKLLQRQDRVDSVVSSVRMIKFRQMLASQSGGWGSCHRSYRLALGATAEPCAVGAQPNSNA